MWTLGIIVAFVAVQVNGKCDQGWTEYDGDCIQFNNHQLSWLDAEHHCRQESAYLATDDNNGKHAILSQFLNIFHGWHMDGFWMGGTDEVIENQWRWLETGLSIPDDSVRWAPGEPNGASHSNCMYMKFFHVANSTDNPDLLWFDEQCGHKHYFICEKRAPSVGVIG